MKEFRAIPLGYTAASTQSSLPQPQTFPISLVKPDKIYDDKPGSDPNAILKYRHELIKASYASLDSKQQVIEEFHEKYTDCSKKSIERVFKEIIIKDKLDGDLRPAWYATP